MNNALVSFVTKDGKDIALNPIEVTSVENGHHGVCVTTSAQETFYVKGSFQEAVDKINPPRKSYMKKPNMKYEGH